MDCQETLPSRHSGNARKNRSFNIARPKSSPYLYNREYKTYKSKIASVKKTAICPNLNKIKKKKKKKKL